MTAAAYVLLLAVALSVTTAAVVLVAYGVAALVGYVARRVAR